MLEQPATSPVHLPTVSQLHHLSSSLPAFLVRHGKDFLLIISFERQFADLDISVTPLL